MSRMLLHILRHTGSRETLLSSPKVQRRGEGAEVSADWYCLLSLARRMWWEAAVTENSGWVPRGRWDLGPNAGAARTAGGDLGKQPAGRAPRGGAT